LIVCSALYCWRLGLVPLEDFDEAYYAEGAREMLARRELGTPYFNGQPFLLKPVLIYWTIAAAFRLLGPTEFAARVTSAFLGTAIVLFTYWFTARTLNRRAGLLAGLALALCYMWIDTARDASIDIPLTAVVTPAMMLCYLATRAEAGRKRWLYLSAYPLFGVALLAKGPAPLGVVLCGLLAYLVSARRVGAVLREAQIIPGLALLLAVAAPWYAYELVHEPTFFSTFFVGEHFGHIQGQLARNGPVWQNLFYVLVYFYPWAVFLPGAFARAFGQRDREHVLRFASWWSIAVIVIFSIPKSKLAHYLAPAFPPMAMLVGAWLDEWLERKPVGRGWTVFAFAALGLGAALCGVAALYAAAPPLWLQEQIAEKFGAWWPGGSPAVILGALGAGALVAVVAARFRRGAVVPALSGAMLVAGFGLVGWLNPRKAEIQAQPRKELAQFAAAHTAPSVPVGVYYAKRNSTIFYLGRPIVDLGERREEFPGLLRFLSSPTPAVAITHARFVPEIERALRDNRDAAGEPSPKPCYVWERRGDYVIVGNGPPPKGG
jgi:hypothetical protein